MSSQSKSKMSENDLVDTTRTNLPSTTEFVNVPSFLLKTYEIVDEPAYDDIVSWNKAGDAFIIFQTNEFCEKVLPLYFKHKNLSSFVRQLNMYGFHKTKYKNNEQCFTHKYFKKDDKRLLLQMKRKTKDKSTDKKSQNSDTFVKSSDFCKIMNDMKSKMKDQDRKISQLMKVNKEFKNSVLTLYTELEKSKERERQSENLLKILTPIFQNMAQNSSDKFVENSSSGQGSDGKFRLSNSDVMNMFKFFMENVVQNCNGQNQNKGFQDNRSEYNYYGNNNGNYTNGEGQINGNLMLENGPLSPRSNNKDPFEDTFNSVTKKREKKALRKSSPKYGDRWNKVQELSQNSKSQNHNYVDNNQKAWDKNTLFGADNSIIGDYDYNKEDKFAENDSCMGQSGQLDDILVSPKPDIPLAIEPAEPLEFDKLSHNSKGSLLEMDSISSFSHDNKLCGKKREPVH